MPRRRRPAAGREPPEKQETVCRSGGKKRSSKGENNMKNFSLVALAGLAGLAVFLAPPLRAEPLPSGDLAHQVAVLHATVDKLQKQVAELEALKPTFTVFMPDFSERFHVLHAAGEAGDWAVADHELKEMHRMLGLAKAIDPQKGQLMNIMLEENLESLETAVQHRSEPAFLRALSNTAATCNKCHTAVGSPFIRVSLDVPDGLTMRHPHRLVHSKPMTGHAHEK